MPEKLLEAKAPEIEVEKPGLTLLWTNPNPNTSMGTTSISFDPNEYIFILIVFKASGKAAATDCWYNSMIFTEKNLPYTISLLNPSDTGVTHSRNFTMTNTGLTVGTGKLTNPFGNQRQSDSYSCIPYKIYGFK